MRSFWKPRHSVRLSLVLTVCSAALLLLLMIFIRPILVAVVGAGFGTSFWQRENWSTSYLVNDDFVRYLATVFYICCPAAWTAMAALFRLLLNLRQGKVFVRQNVQMLRVLSWCFVFVALAALLACPRYHPLLVFFLAAGFLAVILRVVKNVMAEATLLREENDLTI